MIELSIQFYREERIFLFIKGLFIGYPNRRSNSVFLSMIELSIQFYNEERIFLFIKGLFIGYPNRRSNSVFSL